MVRAMRRCLRAGPGVRDERGGARWVALIAVLFVSGGIGLAAWQWRGETGGNPGAGGSVDAAPERAQTDAPIDEPEEAAVEHALRLTPGYSARANKERWVEVIPGIDVADLTELQRDVFVHAANSRRCTCGCGYTLAGCRRFDPDCDVSLPRVEALLDSVRGGKLVDIEGLRPRPRG